jgi:hypothetical protein
MARLIYVGITSLDGYVADVDGNFDADARAGVQREDEHRA